MVIVFANSNHQEQYFPNFYLKGSSDITDIFLFAHISSYTPDIKIESVLFSSCIWISFFRKMFSTEEKFTLNYRPMVAEDVPGIKQLFDKSFPISYPCSYYENLKCGKFMDQPVFCYVTELIPEHEDPVSPSVHPYP